MGDTKPGRGPKKSSKKGAIEASKELAPKTKKK